MSQDLKKETVKGIAWSSIEKFSTQGVNFIVNIILARILTASDFGLIAMVAVFIQISQAFIDSGLTNALIQNKDRNNHDFCTVFYFNLTTSIILYAVLFLCAPLISNFYQVTQLTVIVRFICISLVLGALGSVQQTKLTIKLQFKHLAFVSFLSALISGIVAILLAYNGMGVWALVWMTVTRAGIQMILLFFVTHWFPRLYFSIESFRKLFGYSSKLLLSSLIHLIYYNLYTIVIGKLYNKRELGLYNRAELFARFPATTLSMIISRVAFPIFSSIQDDNTKLAKAYSKYITFSSAIIFPIMVAIISMASPIVNVILTNKWAPLIPLLQILCISWMTDHLCSINLNVLYVKGRSDLALKMELIKKSIATIILLLTMKFGLILICWGLVLYSIIAIIFNSYYTKPLIGLSIFTQLKDYFPILIISAASGILSFFTNLFIEHDVLKLIIGAAVYFISYIIMLHYFQKSIWKEFVEMIRITKERKK